MHPLWLRNSVRVSAAAVFANPIYYGVSDERSCCNSDNFSTQNFPSTTPLKENMNVKYENIYYSTTRRNFYVIDVYIYLL